MFFVSNTELRYQIANAVEDGIERIAVAGEDHPSGQCSSTLTAEDVECPVDDVAGVRFAGASAFDCSSDARSDRIYDRPRELTLESGGGAEMMEQVGMSSAYPRCDSFQSHRLGPVGEEQASGRFDRGRAALFRAQSFASC